MDFFNAKNRQIKDLLHRWQLYYNNISFVLNLQILKITFYINKKHDLDRVFYSISIYLYSILEMATAHALNSAVPDIGSYSLRVRTLVGVSRQ
jgi:hypothetical protein